jgi:hypothetical protein
VKDIFPNSLKIDGYVTSHGLEGRSIIPCRDGNLSLPSSVVAFNLFDHVPPDVISLQLCTTKVVAVLFKLSRIYNLLLKYIK